MGAALHERAAIFARSDYATDPFENFAPDRNFEMHAVGQAADVDAFALVDLVAQQRHIEHAVKGVIADKQRGSLGVDVFEAGHPGAVPQAVHGQQPAHGFCGGRGVGRQWAFGFVAHRMTPEGDE